jgi:glycosyltransferase involved in cell wall biosynthesis
LKRSNTITIIIPTLNEEEGIKKTINSIPLGDLNKIYNVEILVVDGNSKDNTIDIAKGSGAKVIVEENGGYGRAYKTGFLQASGEIIVTMDADATYPAEKIPEYLSFMEKNNLDFLTVNRFSSMDKDSMNTLHKMGNYLLSETLRLIYSVNIRDSQSGMWIMKKSFADRLSIPSDGMSFSQDIKIVAFKYFKSYEVKGSYFKRLGKAKMSLINDGFSNLKNLLIFRKQLPYCIKETSLIPVPDIKN